MAIVQLKWRLSVNLADNSGDVTRRTYEAPEAAFADFAAFTTASTALITLLEALTDAVVAGYQQEVVYVEDNLVLPASGVENENQAFFSGKIDGDPTDSATQSIPAADPDIFIALSGPGANVVDIGDPAVTAWLALFDGTPGWTVSDGEFFDVQTVQGKRRHTKNSSG